MGSDNPSLIRAATAAELPESPFCHPLNPRAEIHMRSLNALAGLQRIGLHIARVPPGREPDSEWTQQTECASAMTIWDAGSPLAPVG